MEKIEYVAFDLDDTLISTREIFRSQEAQVYRILALVLTGVATEGEIKTNFEKTNDSAYQKYKVDPKRWNFVLDKMRYQYPQISSETKAECKDLLMGIYKQVPKLKDGAVETLSELEGSGMVLGVVTHAFGEWTDFKLDKCGLRPYFGERVHVVDMNSSKGASDWQRALNKFDFPISQCAVVGDSLLTDINPAYEIGVKHLFWIDDGRGWKVHEAEKPEIARRINGISELLVAMKG